MLHELGASRSIALLGPERARAQEREKDKKVRKNRTDGMTEKKQVSVDSDSLRVGGKF